MMILRFAFLLFLGWICNSAIAQPFAHAPLTKQGKVKSITEWVRPNLKQKGQKGAISQFNPQGQLVAYALPVDTSLFNTTFQYDASGRLLEKQEGKGKDTRLTRYQYQKDKTIEYILFREKETRVLYFYDKKRRLLEKKTYQRGLELGPKYLPAERVLYQYNPRDSLQKEVIYAYDLPSGKMSQRTNVYKYHPGHGRLIKKVENDFDGQARIITDYTYLTNGQLHRKHRYHRLDDALISTEYLYQNGVLWQEIQYDGAFRHVKIYVEGRLIRLRTYLDDEIYRVVDYQWNYY